MWCVGSKAILSHSQGFPYHVQQLGGLQCGPIPFLVNAPDLSRNLLRVAMSCFIPRISGMYIELETL